MNTVGLNRRVTLALDSHWLPMHFITKRRCFDLLLRKNAVVALDNSFSPIKSNMWFDLPNDRKFEDLPVIRSINQEFQIPSIVVFTNKYIKKISITKPDITKDEMCLHFDFKCQICKKKFRKKDLTIEHIDPRSKSFNDEDFNKTLTCRSCNCEKDDIENWINPHNGKPLKGISINDYVKMKFFVKEYRDEWGHFFIKKR